MGFIVWVLSHSSVLPWADFGGTQVSCPQIPEGAVRDLASRCRYLLVAVWPGHLESEGRLCLLSCPPCSESCSCCCFLSSTEGQDDGEEPWGTWPAGIPGLPRPFQRPQVEAGQYGSHGGPVGATPCVSWHLVSASRLWRLMLFPERGDKFSFVNRTVSLETAARIHELRVPQ